MKLKDPKKPRPAPVPAWKKIPKLRKIKGGRRGPR